MYWLGRFMGGGSSKHKAVLRAEAVQGVEALLNTEAVLWLEAVPNMDAVLQAIRLLISLLRYGCFIERVSAGKICRQRLYCGWRLRVGLLEHGINYGLNCRMTLLDCYVDHILQGS